MTTSRRNSMEAVWRGATGATKFSSQAEIFSSGTGQEARVPRHRTRYLKEPPGARRSLGTDPFGLALSHSAAEEPPQPDGTYPLAAPHHLPTSSNQGAPLPRHWQSFLQGSSRSDWRRRIELAGRQRRERKIFAAVRPGRGRGGCVEVCIRLLERKLELERALVDLERNSSVQNLAKEWKQLSRRPNSSF